ncbi:hypothetical protein HMJ29_05610 [Hymenobacter taeanensis]|uniref:SH3 domain-containing protein n=1 Tax=Hymenobacter taeanensis TaxID=2735321 RepID=A0A6M6BEK1_9BACT|nr:MULTISPECIES: hypothetical protein [Hymenobacter]QJX46440.1 hypothetical protein HMJ29_05610 [Hymenobacter taeanensis]UOQ80302.1 hypothetical protein MUN83_15925 [Hymenobacter sp. 5414T-23]
MNKIVLLFGSYLLLTSCSASRDDSRGNRTSAGPVAHNTVVECVLYDGMNKESKQLTTIGSDTEVQVMDTVDAYFLKVRVTVSGKTENGYMYRNCFSNK